jgi:voltage-gated potassium channel
VARKVNAVTHCMANLRADRSNRIDLEYLRQRMTPNDTPHWARTGGLGGAIALLGVVIVGGTVGYMALEGWSAWDAFYMTVVTVTTVGYKEVHDLSRVGQVFTVVLLLGGVGTALYAFTLLAAAIVDGELPGKLKQRRNARMLNKLRDHFIVCGYGRIGSIVASQFKRQDVPFVVVEQDAGRVKRATAAGVLAVEDDASQEEVLRRVGIERARGVIAAVGTDAENVYTVLTARGLNADVFIIARAESDDSMQKLLRAGANRVISPYHIGGTQIAQTALRPAVVDFMDLALNVEHMALSMEEIAISPTSPLASKTIADAGLRRRFGVIVVGIQRRDRSMEFNPESETRIEGGDKLVVLGPTSSLKELEKEVMA